jgi:hypothetical protein
MNARTRFLFVVLLLSMIKPLRAQELDAGVTWSQPEQGKLVIHYYPSLAAAPEAKNLNPLVFYSLIELDTDSVSVVDTDSKKMICQFKTDKFEVEFEPGAPNVNLLGMCGAAITGIVSITRNGAPVLTQEPFENLDCHERERYIDIITIRDGSAKPEIHYRTYDK